ncbi:hypothetical protein M0804_001464 [Polistes exclamans]|nr:hypothetical protein M0804_001464 [Polistes exclamans]
MLGEVERKHVRVSWWMMDFIVGKVSMVLEKISTRVDSAVRCGAVWCGAVQCGAVQCGTMRCGAVRYNAVRSSAVQCGAVKWYTYIGSIQVDIGEKGTPTYGRRMGEGK